MSMLNINFQPVTVRNYTPERTFVTKWDVEIEKNRVKKLSRNRDRDTKYFDNFDQHSESLPVLKEDEKVDCAWELGSDDEEAQGWLRTIHAENAYYERSYGELYDNFDWYDMNQPQTSCKRNIDFDEHAIFKRIRA